MENKIYLGLGGGDREKVGQVGGDSSKKVGAGLDKNKDVLQKDRSNNPDSILDLRLLAATT